MLKEIKKAMAVADEERDRIKAKAPGELEDMVSQGMERLAQLVHMSRCSPSKTSKFTRKKMY